MGIVLPIVIVLALVAAVVVVFFTVREERPHWRVVP